ncbi:MAG TPA: hypothetical protein PLH72_18945 [Vicinamibacterales bacterium]|nr:hypothetical protein [Vicinamibacterales bacterium]
MKKNVPEPPDPADREIDFSGGERGKYVERLRESGITVRIEPDVARVFPDATAVNEALRKVIRESNEHASEKPR